MGMCPFYRYFPCFFTRMYKIAAKAQAQRIVSTPVSLTKYILLSPLVMRPNTAAFHCQQHDRLDS